MPTKKRTAERRYYEPVQKYLESKGCIVQSFNRDGKPRSFICRGLDRLIVDVYGLRGMKERNSRAVEGIAVEVKPGKTRTSLRHLVQASQYGRLAHRCYLAQPRKFDPRTIADSSRVGVGLLQIKKNGIKPIAESRPFVPDPEKFATFLHKSLRIVRCAMCGCYRIRYRPRGLGHESKDYIRGHWVVDDIAPKRGNHILNKKVYICGRCEGVISGVAKTSLLRKSIERLEKRVRSLQRKLRSK